MSQQDRRRVFERIYGRAKRCEDLPWHQAEPPGVLVQALAGQPRAGTALDLGCGAGTHSIYLARRGYRVTAVDFLPQAVDMTRKRARDAGVELTVVQADVTEFEHRGPFDLVLDVGCLHGLPAGLRPRYRQQLMHWLAPAGDYVLVHFSRRGWWDRWPVGPRRETRAALESFLGSSLTTMACESDVIAVPFAVGLRAEIGRYWFRRTGASRPAA